MLFFVGRADSSSKSGDGGGQKSGEEKKLKPCCACPETKRARDTCIVENGEEHCRELIEAHKACLKRHGFNI